MRALLASTVAPIAAQCLFWILFAACVDAEPEPPLPPSSRVLVAWDAPACEDAAARVAVTIVARADAASIERSVPCDVGWLALDVPHPGAYDASVTGAGLDRTAELEIAAQIVRWTL